MAATKYDISTWFDIAKKNGSTHLIIVCDEFDYEDFPVYVSYGEDVRKRAREEGAKDLQRVMEVYSMAVDKETQMAEWRAFHYE